MKKVSVIIPVHNSEAYLRECMESVVAQRMKEIEFLCIDDNSIDRTLEILQGYASNDDRIRIINDPNGSYGHKINRGIAEAQGKYIGIVESDDKIEHDMFERLFECAEQHQADFVQSDIQAFIQTPEGEFNTKVNILAEHTLYNKVINIAENPLLSMRAIIGIWTGLYNRSFLQKYSISLNETPGASYQDTGFSFLTAIHATRAYYLNKPFYWYRTNNAGSSTKDDGKSHIIIEEFKRIQEKLQSQANVSEDVFVALSLRRLTSYWWNLERLSNSSRLLFLESIREELQSNLSDAIIEAGLSTQMMEFYKDLRGDSELILSRLREQEDKRSLTYTAVINVLKRKQKVVVFGASKMGELLLSIQEIIRTDNICCVCDNNSEIWGTNLGTTPITSPQDAVDHYSDAHFIVGSMNYAEEMKQHLLEMNISEEEITVCDVFLNRLQLLNYYSVTK